MSAGKTSERWQVTSPSYHGWMGYSALRYAIFQPGRLPVDYFRTQAAAEYAARMLNSGQARIDNHAIVGCKVVAA